MLGIDPASRLWDVAVIGSGPAGAAAALGALAAEPSASVLIIDRHAFPRDKCCGDAVYDGVRRELAAYGITLPRLFDGFRPERRLRLVTANGHDVCGDLPRPMTVIPRTVFDARLREAALDHGANWTRQTVQRVADHGDHVALNGNIRARFVIGADGTESLARRAVTPSAPRDLAIALRGYDTADGASTPMMVFEPWDGLSYAWRFPSSAGPANVGYGHILHTGEKANRQELLATLTRLLPGARPEHNTLRAHRLPLATSRQQVARGRILLAGDAAALVNPLSGEGIYYAVLSGLRAGTAAVTPDRDVAARYRDALRRRLGRHHSHVAAMAAAVRLPGVIDAGVRGASADPRAFADLAELGLAEGGISARLAATLVRQLLLGHRHRAA